MHYHAYKLIQETAEAQVEVCTECKHRLITKKDKKGRIDTKKYLAEHIRDTAQPNGRTSKIFNQYYKR